MKKEGKVIIRKVASASAYSGWIGEIIYKDKREFVAERFSKIKDMTDAERDLLKLGNPCITIARVAALAMAEGLKTSKLVTERAVDCLTLADDYIKKSTCYNKAKKDLETAIEEKQPSDFLNGLRDRLEDYKKLKKTAWQNIKNYCDAMWDACPRHLVGK